MSKKVLILSSSPRRNGNSDLLCNEFMRGAAEAGHQVEKIFLKDKHINYCTGCSVCSMYGKPCPQKDDAAEVVEKMIADNTPDMFILDEPTNNLDIESIEIITATIRDYAGTVIAISHDREFLKDTGIEREILLE